MKPTIKYYDFRHENRMFVALDPQDGSEWPYHNMVEVKQNDVTGEWELSKKVMEPLNIVAASKDEATAKAINELSKMLMGG